MMIPWYFWGIVIFAAEFKVESGLLKRAPSGAYIHIPFCRRRCHYCNFPVSVVGDSRKSALIAGESYVKTLFKEIEVTQELLNEKRPLETLYFGGGTPSLLSNSRKK